MALIKCKNCGNFISDKAMACPKCGAENMPDVIQPGKENTVSVEDGVEDGVDELKETPKRSYKRLWILPILIGLIILGGGIGYYFYSEHQAKLEQARLEALRLEQLRLDSIEAARLDSIRQDSIANEERLRFSASVLISEMIGMEAYDPNYLLISQPLNKDWENNLIDLGFEKQAKILKVTNCTGYGDELYDIYGIPYIRILNGRQITVEPQYAYYKRGQLGDWIPEKERELWLGYECSQADFDITFSDIKDADHFRKSLNEIGLTKHCDGMYDNKIHYDTDELKFKSAKSYKSKGVTSPLTRCIEKDSLSFTVNIGGNG